MFSWVGAARGDLHIHVHIHSKKEGLVFEILKQMDNVLNAGIEAMIIARLLWMS